MNKVLLEEQITAVLNKLELNYFRELPFGTYYCQEQFKNEFEDELVRPYYHKNLTVNYIDALIKEFVKKNSLNHDENYLFLMELINFLKNSQKELNEQLNDKNIGFTVRMQIKSFLIAVNKVIEFVEVEISDLNNTKTSLENKTETQNSIVTSKNNVVSQSSNSNKEKNKPIKWHGTNGQLIYLFELLRNANYFSLNANLQAEIRNHFVDKDGNEFKNLKNDKQSYLNNKGSKPKNSTSIEEFVKKVIDKKK